MLQGQTFFTARSLVNGLHAGLMCLDVFSLPHSTSVAILLLPAAAVHLSAAEVWPNRVHSQSAGLRLLGLPCAVMGLKFH